MKTSTRLILVAALLLCGMAANPAKSQTRDQRIADADRPNIIFLMADDLGWGDVGFNGSEVIRTPALDKLAGEGVTYKRFYAASPICSPTRGSCLTGRHPYRFGVLAAHTAGLRQGELTIAEIAKSRGYTTGMFGKWHLGFVHPSQEGSRGYYSPPERHGFDETFVTNSAVPTWDPMVTPRGWNAWGNREGEPWKDGEIYYHNGELVTDNLAGDDSRVIMDRVVPFVEQAVANEHPFLACVWFHTPHEPVVAGPEYRKMYSEYSTEKQHYYGCITAMDDQVKRLDDVLTRLGIKDDTVVFFCSDNGPSRQNLNRERGIEIASAGPYRGTKHTAYEGGLRVPCFMVWPGRIAPGESGFMAGTVDYFPTVAELIGYEFSGGAGRPIDGVSLLANLRGAMAERPTPLYCGYRRLWKNEDVKAFIQNRYKLVHQEMGEWQMFDLLADPYETNDLAHTMPERLAELRDALDTMEQSVQRSLNGADYRY